MQVQESQRVPNKMDAKRPTPRHIIIKMPKVKDKERILKAGREKETITYKGVPISYQLMSPKKSCRQVRARKKFSKSQKERAYIQDYSMQQSYHLEWKGR